MHAERQHTFWAQQSGQHLLRECGPARAVHDQGLQRGPICSGGAHCRLAYCVAHQASCWCHEIMQSSVPACHSCCSARTLSSCIEAGHWLSNLQAHVFMMAAVHTISCNVCRRLFAELQEGPKRSADPTCFAEALNLDRSIQQVDDPCPPCLQPCVLPQIAGSSHAQRILILGGFSQGHGHTANGEAHSLEPGCHV